MKTPKHFQEESIELILNNEGLVIGDECGLGKTLTAVEAGKRLAQNPSWRSLVVCPKKLADQWANVIADQMPGVPVLVVNKIPYILDDISGWVIITYPEIDYKPVYDTVSRVLWDYIVIDEAHRIKNRKTKAFDKLRQLYAVKVVCLTGTPMEKSPGDLWTLLNITHPDAFPSYWTYAEEWLEEIPDYYEYKKFGQPKDPAAFGNMLTKYFIRHTKADVMPELPEKIIIPTFVAPEPKQGNLLREMKKSQDILFEYEGTELLIPNALSMLTRMQQASTDPALIGMKMPSGKLAWLFEFVKDHPEEPTIVFSRFRDIMLELAYSMNGAYVVGGSDDNYLRFVNGEVNLVFCTIDSIEGVDGLQRAKYAIFLDSHWSTIKMTQAIDRIHRMDITEPKVIYQLYSCREDQLVLDALEKKWIDSELVYYFMYPDKDLGT